MRRGQCATDKSDANHMIIAVRVNFVWVLRHSTIGGRAAYNIVVVFVGRTRSWRVGTFQAAVRRTAATSAVPINISNDCEDDRSPTLDFLKLPIPKYN